MGEVEGVWVKKFVEVVAADPAHDFGVAGVDLCTVGLGDAGRLTVDMAEKPGARDP